MPATLNLNTRYEWSERSNWVEGLYTLVRRQDRLSASDRLDDQRIPPGGDSFFVNAIIDGQIKPSPKGSVL